MILSSCYCYYNNFLYRNYNRVNLAVAVPLKNEPVDEIIQEAITDIKDTAESDKEPQTAALPQE